MENKEKELDKLLSERSALANRLAGVESQIDGLALSRSKNQKLLEELYKESDELEEKIEEYNKKIDELRKKQVSKR